jgi:ribA/ribD-fused uncharacterized protein
MSKTHVRRTVKKATKSVIKPPTESVVDSSEAHPVHLSHPSHPSHPTYIAFWKPRDPGGLYSQWYSSKFVFNAKTRQELPDPITSLSIFSDHPDLIDGIEGSYSCAEQFMMIGKALLFKDEYIATQIRDEDSPARHKKLGRRVSNFDNTVWMSYATDIVTLASYLKFSQNWRLKKEILETGNATLIEGSPMDKIWGVNLRYDDSTIADPKNWKGLNLLGQCLMEAREIIRSEQD